MPYCKWTVWILGLMFCCLTRAFAAEPSPPIPVITGPGGDEITSPRCAGVTIEFSGGFSFDTDGFGAEPQIADYRWKVLKSADGGGADRSRRRRGRLLLIHL